MRYTVGHSYAFALISFEPVADYFSHLYIPTIHTLNSIDVIVLKCVEHHKVPYADTFYNNERRADGFIFVDENNRRWVNQYPSAIYGQTDDSNDRVVQREYIQHVDGEITDRFMTRYTDAFSMLAKICEALHTKRRVIETDDMRKGFEKYLNDFQTLVEEKIDKKIAYRNVSMTQEGKLVVYEQLWEAYVEEKHVAAPRKTDAFDTFVEASLSAIRVANDHAADGILKSIIMQAVGKGYE